MWSIILKAIPWQTLFALIVKLILVIVDKGKETEEAKKAFLLFLDAIDDKVTVKLNDEYERQKKEVVRLMNEKKEEIDRLRKILRAMEKGADQ